MMITPTTRTVPAPARGSVQKTLRRRRPGVRVGLSDVRRRRAYPANEVARPGSTQKVMPY